MKQNLVFYSHKSISTLILLNPKMLLKLAKESTPVSRIISNRNIRAG